MQEALNVREEGNELLSSASDFTSSFPEFIFIKVTSEELVHGQIFPGQSKLAH